jgi:hypothetical protein
MLEKFRSTQPQKHFIRIGTILATTSFWLVCAHYFGAKAAFYTGAAWAFALGIKDFTYMRVRLKSADKAERRGKALKTIFLIELLLLLLRMGLMTGLTAILRVYSAQTAIALSGMIAVCFLWMREMFTVMMRAYGVRSLAGYISLTRALTGLVTLIVLAEWNWSAPQAAAGALLTREAVTFVGQALAVFAGKLGLRTKGEAFDDEDGVEQDVIESTDNRTITSQWSLLLADNLVWSRWRWMQFATRNIASGIFGPFGTIGARMLFAYRRPGKYVHGGKRISIIGILAFAIPGMATMIGIYVFAHHHRALTALGITLAGFGFRLFALSLNALFWQQMAKLIGVKIDIRRITRKMGGRRRNPL